MVCMSGDVPLASPRLHRCTCQPDDGPATVPCRRSENSCPITSRLNGFTLKHVGQSLVPYAAAAKLLADVLSVTSGANRTTPRELALL